MNNKTVIEDLPECFKLEEDEVASGNGEKKWTKDQRIEHLRRILKTQAMAFENIFKKVNAAEVENALLVKQRDRAIENMNSQVQTLHHAMEQHAQNEKSLTSEIIELRQLLRANGINPDKR